MAICQKQLYTSTNNRKASQQKLSLDLKVYSLGYSAKAANSLLDYRVELMKERRETIAWWNQQLSTVVLMIDMPFP